MISRRTLLAAWAGLPWPLSAADAFWNKRPAAEWSPKEIERMLTRSPWAKETVPSFDMSRMSGGPPGGGLGGPGMGGPGGPGMGGPPGGMAGGPPGGGMPPGGMPQLQALVRWESALPVREATRRLLPDGAGGHYMLRLSGLPMMTAPDRPPAGRENPAFAAMRESTQLLRKGKDPIGAEDLRVSPAEGAILIFFPRTSQPVRIEDKEVTFVSRISPLELKVRFPLRDMLFRGEYLKFS